MGFVICGTAPNISSNLIELNPVFSILFPGRGNGDTEGLGQVPSRVTHGIHAPRGTYYIWSIVNLNFKTSWIEYFTHATELSLASCLQKNVQKELVIQWSHERIRENSDLMW